MTRNKKNVNKKDLLNVFKILLEKNSAANVRSRDGSNRKNRKNGKGFKDFLGLYMKTP